MSLLESVHTHATIALVSNGEVYINFKKEALEAGAQFISFDIEDKSKNLKMEDVEFIQNLQSSKSSDKRYVFVEKSIRNTLVQSAMLKLLEEPTKNTFIVIFTTSKDMLLPTVLSRCELVNFTDKSAVDDKKVFINKIINSSNMAYAAGDSRWSKLERFLNISTLADRGLISDKQMGEYREIV